MAFSIVIDPRAIADIQQAIDYYDLELPGLGLKFEAALNNHLITLTKNPHFEVRYDNVRCLPIKKFPFMIHFTVDQDQNIVSVRAVLHTALDPKKWYKR